MDTIDTSKANADLYAALAKAQAAVESVGKDGTNTQRGYRYATTEAMIRGSRQHLAAHGIAFFHTWTKALPEVAPGDIGKQHVAATVTIHWVMGHVSGGQVSGVAHMDAIGSPARPPDKAVAAAVTYGLGFVLRGILLIDRADEDEHAPDRRHEPESTDPIWDAYVVQRDLVAKAKGLSADQAHTLIRESAGITYSGEPTDGQVTAMSVEAAQILAASAPSKAKPKPKPRAKKAKAPEVDALNDARAMADIAMKAYRDECKAQGVKETPWLEIAAKAIGKPWDTTKGSHGPQDYILLADAFEAETEGLRA